MGRVKKLRVIHLTERQVFGWKKLWMKQMIEWTDWCERPMDGWMDGWCITGCIQTHRKSD